MAETPRLLDRVRAEIRARHYSRRTEEAYVHWIRRYILFHGKRHPADLGAAHVTAFLTLVSDREIGRCLDAESGVQCADIPVP